jgi:flagellar motor switch protein FliM
METVPEALQFAQREEHVLVATFSARVGKRSATMALCLPLRILESFLADASAARSAAAARRTDGVDCRPQIEGVVREAHIPVVVRLPLFTLSAREVAGLDERRILMTSHPVGEPVEVHVGGRRRFLGLPGQSRQALGVRITETFVGAPEDPARTAPKGHLL